jgi:formamidopyrimidine-DNA glycosylase
MPELPEVETTLRGLATYLQDERIVRVEIRREGLRRPFPPDLAQALTGATVTGLSRRAKYGLIATDRDRTMVFHLGMSGRWRIDPDTQDKHDHLILKTDAGHVLALNDARRFGSVDLVDTDKVQDWGPLASLGPEPLEADLTVDHLANRFAGKVSAVKLLLLDQSVVAGLGNIYVCEALLRAGVAPTRAGRDVTRAELERLIPAIRTVLQESIAAGGSTIRDYAQPNGELGYFAANWQVYGRQGQACATCATPIERMTQGGRSSFWCPSCQS